MQYAKDTFFVTIRDRLAALNPQRTITLDGQVRPAVVCLENEPVTFADPTASADPQTTPTVRKPTVAEAFYVAWGAPRVVAGFEASARPLMAVACTIAFCALGTPERGGVDRGRVFAQLEQELAQVCAPASAAKADYTQAPAAALGTHVMWTRPRFANPEAIGAELHGGATLSVFFYPEVNC